MVMPTAMKNSPSSRPLNGSMSASSSWRYSESASNTPARNAPSAMDRPADWTNNAVPITTSKAAAINTSWTRGGGRKPQERAQQPAAAGDDGHDDATGLRAEK